uniref:Uncharacterized protein n=1 Tax=Setaria italica TaxID=4555 RepID=K3YFF5_SETIT
MGLLAARSLILHSSDKYERMILHCPHMLQLICKRFKL